ncbi:Nucleoside transporter family protein [Cryptosporidium felis]|nr:Nucleoside transporter family protein [Cryptosporidium felis]
MKSERFDNSSTVSIPHLHSLLQSGGLIPRHEMLYARLVFITFGIASLFMWNTYLSCCGVMNKQLFPGMGFIQYVQTSYMSSVFIGNITMVLGLTHIFDPHHCTVIFNCVGALQSSIICLSVWFLQGTFVGCFVNLLIAGLVAFSCAILIPETFTLAAIMPESFCSDVSLGQSLSGVITFTLTLLLDVLLPHDVQGRRLLVTLMFGVSTAVSLLAAYMAQSLTKSPWSYSAIAEIRKRSGASTQLSAGNQRNDSVVSYEDSLLSIPISLDTERSFEYRNTYLEVTRQIWPQLYNIFMSFMVTLAVFPTISTEWNPLLPEKYSNVFMVVLVGMFHFGDMLGRHLPRLGLVVPPSLLWILTTSRLGFIPLYAAIKHASPGSFLGSAWTQVSVQFVLAFTNGFSAYLAFIYGPETVYFRHNKEKASFLLAIYNVAGMTAGSWLMNVLIWVRYF